MRAETRIVEREEMAINRQWHDTHASLAADTHASLAADTQQ
jgi:hypothetical protein